MDSKLKAQFLDILKEKAVYTVFQPIVSLRDGSIYAYEALSRGPKDTPFESPSVLFDYAQRYDKIWDLELLCHSRALKTLHKMQVHIKLFLNVNPNIMHDSKFKEGFTKEYLKKYDINPQNIVFEITEREAVYHLEDFISAIQTFKDQSYKIAIDDAGAGYSGLNLISDVRPHFIKIDMNLVREIDQDVTKQALVRSLSEYASLSNTKLIGEGVETERELLKLIELGVGYAQGYYLQKPATSLFLLSTNVVDKIKEANRKRNNVYGRKIHDIYIGNIATPLMTIHPDLRVMQVYSMLKEDRTLPGFCISKDNTVMGVITRQELFKHISGQYGYDLYKNRPIQDLMSNNFLCVDEKSTIDVVAKSAMQRDYEHIYDFITITRDDLYIGIATVKDLLEKAIEIEVINAKHLNPLSELPGNFLIEKQLEKYVADRLSVKILYFDLDNFKAYNDVYGFENGDRILKLLTQILKKHIPSDEFIGHIGGDDFVVMLEKTPVEAICENVISEFDQSVKFHYSQDDINRGFIISKNRNDIEETFPLISVSIAGVSSERFENIYTLSENISKLKKHAKLVPGSCYIIQ